MKIRNLKIHEKLNDIGFFSVAGIFIVGAIAYQFVDIKEQVIDTPDTIEDFNKDGDTITKEFLPGEHQIKRTRVDSFYYETEPIEGYAIESVAVKGYSDKNIITYVNTLPVVVHGKEHSDGTVTFDEFGEVITRNSVKTIEK